MKKILLDTNAYSNFLKGDEKILKAISESDIIYLSVFVLAELYYGFKAGSREKKNKEYLNESLKKIRRFNIGNIDRNISYFF